MRIGRNAVALFIAGVVVAEAAMGMQPEIVRADDLELPLAWTRCLGDEQCVRIAHGCKEISVNAGHAKAARALSLRVAGDPALLRCAPRDTKTWSAALCLENTCVLVRAPQLP
ncbi:MAG: hypothetical protein JSR19_08670 [Proteobacteria bacterium]|nr:hypothetical protein [Pseudomonadota bacterium]HQR04166.1 hypothetical protein [Rhodocyclaceae bacterium]